MLKSVFARFLRRSDKNGAKTVAFFDEPGDRFLSGELFEVPLLDGSAVVAQIVSSEGSPLPGLLCIFSKLTVQEYERGRDLTEKDVIAIQFTLPEYLVSERWSRFGRQGVVAVQSMPNLRDLRAERFIGAETVGPKIIENFLNAYFGLAAWDKPFDPAFYDSLLVEPKKRPSRLVFEATNELR